MCREVKGGKKTGWFDQSQRAERSVLCGRGGCFVLLSETTFIFRKLNIKSILNLFIQNPHEETLCETTEGSNYWKTPSKLDQS